MKKTKLLSKAISLMLAGAILFASCSSSTLIQSSPSGAKVYLNGEYAGVTPYTHTDTKIVGSSTQVRLEKEGYLEKYFQESNEGPSRKYYGLTRKGKQKSK